jgi:hypothetical protein
MNSAQEDADVPVLTEVVEDLPAAPAAALDRAALEALADQLERVLLERLRPEVDRVAARALDSMRVELTTGVLRIVREAVAASVAKALGAPRRH